MIGIAARYLNLVEKFFFETMQKHGCYLTAPLKTRTIYDRGLPNGNYMQIKNKGPSQYVTGEVIFEDIIYSV